MKKEKVSEMPVQTGVYIFKDKYGTIIYIGKAKNIKKRVQSYFSSKKIQSPKTQLLAKNIGSIDYIIVNNEIEALLLENKLIKKHSPKYNIDLKDSKTYAYIAISSEKFPRIYCTRKITGSDQYFGPYVDSHLRKKVMGLCIKIFRIRTCRNLPKKECLSYHMGICTAPCINKISEKKYLRQVLEAAEFLGGKTARAIKKLTADMKRASDALEYETALEKKGQLDAINYLNEKQRVDLIKKFDQDVIAYDIFGEKIKIVMFSISKGVVLGKKEFSFDYDEDAFESFIKMYYSNNYVPEEIILNRKFWEKKQEKNLIEKYLKRLTGKCTRIIVPKLGEKLEILKIAEKNLEHEMENKILKELKEKLGLSKIPVAIECFDVSNLGEKFIVGGMTRWVNGNPDKNNYRRFEIRGVNGQNDVSSIKEIVYRRYKKLKEENLKYPDLILIDGGIGQLNAAVSALDGLKIKIPAISLAKKEEEIYFRNCKTPLRLDKNLEMMRYLRKIRDSAHNFTIAYNRKKRELKFEKDKK
ncbi:MAG: excinuclease ABC subunit UvrC [Candidatus Micrarchaeia archaeon]